MKKIFPLLLVFLVVIISVLSIAPMGVDGALYDDFNDGNDDGWTPIRGTWEVRDNAYYTSIGVANSYSVLDDSNFSNYTIEVKVKFAGTNVGFRQGIIFRYNSGNFYDYWISYEYQRLGICKHVNNDLYGDTLTPIYSVSFSAGVYHSLKIIVEGDCFEAYLDDIWMFTVYDDSFSYGEVGVIALRTDAYFDDFSVSFISSSPIAILSASQSKINADDTVIFDGSNSVSHPCEITKHFFDYGDGHNSGWITEPITSYTYIKEGDFSSRLKVMTSLGNVSDWSNVVHIFVYNNGRLYDGFGGATIDTAKWTIEDIGGLSASIENGRLKVNGSYDDSQTVPGSAGWNHYRLTSHQVYYDYLEVSVENKIIDFTSAEYGDIIHVGLGIENESNYVAWYQRYYHGGMDAIGYCHVEVDGLKSTKILDDTDITLNIWHTHKIVYNSTSENVDFYVDNSLKGSKKIKLTNFKVFLIVGIKNSDTSITIKFDDFLAVDPRHNKEPTAILTTLRKVIELGDIIIFDATESNDVDGITIKYYFDFGDGTNSGWVDTPKIAHLYATTGTYIVRLTVKDDNGSVSTNVAQVNIQANTPGLLPFKNPFVYFIIAAIIGIAIFLIIFMLKMKKIEKR